MRRSGSAEFPALENKASPQKRDESGQEEINNQAKKLISDFVNRALTGI
jgi:hypothetical protein